MQVARAFVGLALLGACASTSYAPPAVSTAKGGADASGTIRYLALGDSLTQGQGADDMETGSFPALLAKHWRTQGCKVELKNVGVSGYTAGQVVSEELPAVATFKPTFITFQAGANDIANAVTIDEYTKNVRKVLSDAKASGARVVVFAQNEWFRSPTGAGYGPNGGKRDAYDEVLFEEARAKGAEIIDLRLLYKQQADNNEWGPDGIHPTSKAYAAWATELARVIPAPCAAR